MVGTIRPVVYRKHQMLNWIAALLFHLLGSMLAAMFVGAVIGVAAQWVVPQAGGTGLWLAAVVAPISLLYALSEVGIVRLPRPQINRQVPASWRSLLHPHLVSFLYGLGLGTGFATRIITGTFYVLVIGVFAVGNSIFAMLAFTLFGVGRALPIGLLGWQLRSSYTGEQIHPFLERVVAHMELMHFLNSLAMSFLAGYLLVGLSVLARQALLSVAR